MTLPAPNEGERPSRFLLARYATGELSAEEAAALEARLDDEARAWLAELEATRSAVPAPDVAALRRRAGAPVEGAAPANNTRWYGLVMLVLAAVVLAVVTIGRVTAPTGPDIRFRTGDALVVHRLDQGRLVPYEPGVAVGEGDVLGFKVGATGHRTVVLMSVDASGRVEVYWPESGTAGEPLRGDGLVPLPGSLTLDDARGPEVFVAVFDSDVAQARSDLEHTWQIGGVVGVLDWASAVADVDAVEVTRR